MTIVEVDEELLKADDPSMIMAREIALAEAKGHEITEAWSGRFRRTKLPAPLDTEFVRVRRWK